MDGRVGFCEVRVEVWMRLFGALREGLPGMEVDAGLCELTERMWAGKYLMALRSGRRMLMRPLSEVRAYLSTGRVSCSHKPMGRVCTIRTGCLCRRNWCSEVKLLGDVRGQDAGTGTDIMWTS